MAANNETGVMNDIRKIGQIISDYNNSRLRDSEDKILFHSDCVQVFGKKKIDVEEKSLRLLWHAYLPLLHGTHHSAHD